MIDPIKRSPVRRATLADVAREAGVSVPTVDRVLNRRAPVKPETAQRVQAAAALVGFHAARLLARRATELRPDRKLGFLLQNRASEFYRNFAGELTRAARNPNLGHHQPVVEHMEDLTPGAVADRILRLGEKCDALAVVAADHPKVNAAVERVSQKGPPVYTLLSDIGTEARAGYFGMDHRKAGRTAGWAMTRFAEHGGDLAIVLGNHRYLGHELCEVSFRAYLREVDAGFRLMEPLTSYENPRFAYEATLDLIKRSPKLAGIYAPGGGIEGIVEALRERPAGRRIAVVGMEVIAATRDALIDGVIDLVLATPIAAVASGVVNAMLARLDGLEPPSHPRAGLPFEIYGPENV